MRVLIINAILFTSYNNVIPKVKSIKDTMIYDLCLGFKNKGCDVVLAAAEDYKPICQEEYPFEIIFFKTSCKKIFKPSLFPFMPELYRYIKENRNNLDAVISSELFSLNSLSAALALPKRTIIWQELGLHNNKMKKIPSKVWYNVVAPLFMRKCTVVCRSEKAQNFVSRYHKNVKKEIIGHGVNISKLNASKDKKDHFIVIARLVPTKNISSVINKFILFKNKYPKYSNYKLYIAGNGIMEEELKKEVQFLRETDSIIFLGYTPHEKLNEYLSTAKCFLSDSLLEMCMLSLFEAVTSATPVVTNLVPYNNHVIKEGNLGIVKDNWNETDIMDIVENNDYYVSNCYNYRNNLTVEASVNKFLKLIVKL